MAVGYVTRSVEAIVTALVIFEACKFLVLLCWFCCRRLFTVTLDMALIRDICGWCCHSAPVRW